jgi:hypothetical protein
LRGHSVPLVLGGDESHAIKALSIRCPFGTDAAAVFPFLIYEHCMRREVAAGARAPLAASKLQGPVSSAQRADSGVRGSTCGSTGSYVP